MDINNHCFCVDQTNCSGQHSLHQRTTAVQLHLHFHLNATFKTSFSHRWFHTMDFCSTIEEYETSFNLFLTLYTNPTIRRIQFEPYRLNCNIYSHDKRYREETYYWFDFSTYDLSCHCCKICLTNVQTLAMRKQC